MNSAEAGIRTNGGRWIAMTRREWLWLGAASLAYAVVFAYPMLCETVNLGPGTAGWISQGPIFSHLARFPANGDWDMFTQLRWVPYYTVTHFHQLPFWNPYKCGGMGMLGNPESAIVTPFFIPYLLFGPYSGLYIEILLHMAIGFAGGYVLGRVLGLHRLASVVCAIVFPASSWLGLHLSVGHLNFLPALYLPAAPWIWRTRSYPDRLFPAALAGFICALTLTEGNYSFLYAGIFLALSGLVIAVLRLSIWPIVSGLIVGLFAGGFAALKLFPAWEMLTVHPRVPFGPEWDQFPAMMIYLFSRNQDLYRTGASVFGLSEYGGSISLAFAVLGVVGVVAAPRKCLPWILPAWIFFWLAEGDTGPHSALMFLRHFPLTSNIDLPARFIIPFVFCAGLIIAQGAHVLCTRGGRFGVAAVAILLVVGSVDAWLVGAPNFRYLFHNETEALPHSEYFRQYWVSNPGIQTEISQANMGSVNCQGYGYNAIPEDALGYNQTGYRGEYYLLTPGEVTQTEWTPNRLSYAVNAPSATTLVINQNTYPGWRLVSGDGELYSEHGLLAVRLRPGRHVVTLRFRPTRILLASILTLASFAMLLAVWWMEREENADPADASGGRVGGKEDSKQEDLKQEEQITASQIEHRAESSAALQFEMPRREVSAIAPTLALASRFFVVATMCFAGDIVVRGGWFHRAPNYISVAAAILASAGFATIRVSRQRQPLNEDADAMLGIGAERWCEFAVFVAFLAFYGVTGIFDPSPYNAHIREAFAFLHGHVDIDAPYYIEHAVFHGRSYELHPPLPAFILMPIVALFGMDTNQTAIALVIGAIDIALAWRVLQRFGLVINARVWLTMFFGAGTIIWFETIGGSSWAVAMLFAIAFTLPALDEVFGSARPLWVGIFAGLAALARNDLALVWPMYAALTYLKRRDLRELAWMIPGFAAAAIVYVGFNWIRYHSIVDHTEFIFVESFAKGTPVFGLQYLPGNINTLLFMAPVLSGGFPWFHPTFGGQSLLLTSPAFLLALRPSFRRLEVALVGLGALAAMTPSLLYFANGYSQYGTRHYLHVFPFLLVLMALGLDRRADQLTRILIVASVVLVAFGVWHVQTFGYA